MRREREERDVLFFYIHCFAHQQLMITDDVTDRTRLHPSILKHETKSTMTPDDEDDDDGGRHDLTLFHRRGTVNRCVYARTSRMLLAVFTWDRRDDAQQCDSSVATTMRFYPAIRIFFQVVACRAQSAKTGSRSDNARATLRRILRGYDGDGRGATRRWRFDAFTVYTTGCIRYHHKDRTDRTRVERGDRASEWCPRDVGDPPPWPWLLLRVALVTPADRRW